MASSYLVLDIETVLDPELPISQAGEVERLPAAPHHKVMVLGALLFDQMYQVRRIAVLAEGKDESGVLFDFARLMEERRPCLVTFNGRGFDMPVIASRCLRYGITFRHYYHTRDVRYMHKAATEYVTGPYLEEEFWEDLRQVTGGATNESLARLTIRESEELGDWMPANGVRWQKPLRGTLHLTRTNLFMLGGGKAIP